ncbi:MAG: hypothetical protein ABIF08_04580 [Nanoarchaeota archaeon]
MKSKMKKGITSVSAIFFLAFIIALILATLSGLYAMNVHSTAVEDQSNIHFDFYNSKNALKAAKTYMESAHSFSLYQAVYDNFRFGGYMPGEVPNSISSSVSVDDKEYDINYALFGTEDDFPAWEEVIENIKTSFKNNLKKYLEDYYFLNSYIVRLPSIDSFDVSIEETVKIEDDNCGDGVGCDPNPEVDVLKLKSTTTNDKLVLSGTHELYGRMELKESFSLDRTYNIKAKGLYEKAREHFDTAKPMLTAAKDAALQEIIDNPAVWIPTGSGSIDSMPEEIFASNFANFDEKKGNLIQKHFGDFLNSEPIEEGDYFIAYNLVVGDVGVDPTCDSSSGTNMCNFEYSINAVVKVEVFDNSQTFPVGHHIFIVEHPLFFRFYLMEGNVESIPSDGSDVISTSLAAPITAPDLESLFETLGAGTKISVTLPSGKYVTETVGEGFLTPVLTVTEQSLLAAMEHAKTTSILGRNCLCGDNCADYAKWIVQYSEEIGLNTLGENPPGPLLALSMIMQESSCKEFSCNPWGYGGLMQIDCKPPGEIPNWQNPETNIKEGLLHLKGKYDQFKDGKQFTGACKNDPRYIEPVDKWYYGWQAAVRGYIGWGCNEDLPQQNLYAEEVYQRYDELASYISSIS